MNDRIQPRTLKGFRDFLPEAMIRREWVIETAKRVYRKYGYSPIDTPALEFSEILLGKGGDESDKQLYRFDDQGGRDVAMRFDLTVPLARFIAQHAGTLGTPFKRYHVGIVWRGENTQRGRYREFLQCDFDTIGSDSIVADIECVVVIVDLFLSLGFERFSVRINNRRVLNGLLERLGLEAESAAVLRALDKLPKIGTEGVESELKGSAGASADQAAKILEFASLTGSNEEILAALPEMVAGSDVGMTGLRELSDVIAGVAASGFDPGLVKIDLSIARGLDYYTGTIVETYLDDLPDIGSVLSGGRYDDLASLYTAERLPGVGAALGVDRLLAAIEELDHFAEPTSAAEVLVTLFEEARRDDHIALAGDLRRSGLAVELYPEPKKLGAQLKYADRRRYRFVVIVGPVEWEAGTAQIKDLASGESEVVPHAELAAALLSRLSAS